MVNIKNILALFILFTLVISQSGCNIGFSGRTEMSNIEFIRALAIDKSSNKENTVRLTIATQTIKAPDGGSGQSKYSEILFSEGNTMFEAVRNFWSYMDKRPFWGHLEYILIGQEAAEDGLLKYIDFFSRDPEIRLNLKVFIVDGCSAEEAIIRGNSEDKFIFDRLEGVSKNQWGQSEFNVVDLMEVMYILDNKYLSLYIPCVRLANFTIGEKHPDQKMDIIIEGFAIFKEDKLFGFLRGKRGRAINWLKNKIKSGLVVVKSPEGNEISLEVHYGHTKLIPKIDNGKLTVTVKVDLASNIGEISSSEDIFTGKTFGDLEKQQEQIIKEEIENLIKYAQDMKLDIFGASSAVHRKYPVKWEDIYQTNWEDKFAEIKFDIVVNSVISRTYDIKQPSRSKAGENK